MSRQALVAFVNKSGGSLMPDNDQWTNRFTIRSETSSREYTVAQHKTNKTWGCSCMGWKRHRSCKHLKAMMPSLQRIAAH